MSDDDMLRNRKVYLEALRSGKYIKGPYIKGESKPPKGAIGYCALGLMSPVFNIYTAVGKQFKEKFGLTSEDLGVIQNEWNDSGLTFPQIADLMEHVVFPRRSGCTK